MALRMSSSPDQSSSARPREGSRDKLFSKSRWTVALLLGLAACSGAPEQPAEDPDPLPIPASTIPVVDHFRECKTDRKIGQEESKLIQIECLKTGLAAQCQKTYDKNIESIQQAWVECMKDLPMVSQECRNQFDPTSFTHDSDADGVSDGDEALMSLNPCEPCTSGGFPEDCDGPTDYDGDGTPNAEDADPTDATK